MKNKIIGYVNGLPLEAETRAIVHDPATGQFTSGGESSISPEQLHSLGWHLEPFHKEWIRTGLAHLVMVPLTHVLPVAKNGESIAAEVDAYHKKGHSKISGILQDWKDGYRHPVVEGIRHGNKIEIMDGRHRTAAAIISGRTHIPIVVTAD